MSYFDPREASRPDKVSVKISDGYFLLKGQKRSGGSLGKHLRRSSIDFDGVVRYSSVKRERKSDPMERIKRMSMNSKRSASISHTDLMQKRISKKQRRKKAELKGKITEMKRLYKGKDYLGAVSIGEFILEEYPKQLEALYYVGLSSSFLDDHKKAIQNFEKLILLEAKFEKIAYLFLATDYKKMGQREEAIKVLEKAVKYFPKYYDAYVSYIRKETMPSLLEYVHKVDASIIL